MELSPASKVVRLYKIVNDNLIACEAIEFKDGAPAIDTTFRRAAISGRVELEGDIKDHFADILTSDDCTLLHTVALDRKSYASLKNRWMRCNLDKELNR
jgi:hypothetical protein